MNVMVIFAPRKMSTESPIAALLSSTSKGPPSSSLQISLSPENRSSHPFIIISRSIQQSNTYLILVYMCRGSVAKEKKVKCRDGV